MRKKCPKQNGIKLTRVPLNRGGYDRQGRYFGIGIPVWKAEAEVAGQDRAIWVRGGTCDEAMREAQSGLAAFAKWPYAPLQGPPVQGQRMRLVDTIRAGDKVTIVNRFGQQHTGRAVMRGPYGWVLNMGGRHGTPGIASDENVVKVVGSKVRHTSSGCQHQSVTTPDGHGAYCSICGETLAGLSDDLYPEQLRAIDARIQAELTAGTFKGVGGEQMHGVDVNLSHEEKYKLALDHPRVKALMAQGQTKAAQLEAHRIALQITRVNLGDHTEADEAATTPYVALRNLIEKVRQLRKGEETMAVTEMYADAARRAGVSYEKIATAWNEGLSPHSHFGEYEFPTEKVTKGR